MLHADKCRAHILMHMRIYKDGFRNGLGLNTLLNVSTLSPYLFPNSFSIKPPVLGFLHAADRVKAIISPNESLTPGLLYVGVATLTGSIISRNRFILTRFIIPPLFLVASANHFLPQTTHNLSQYLGSLEDTYLPAVAQKHEVAKAHSLMGWEMLKESTQNARAQVNQTAVKAVEKIQGATGLKIKETLGLSGEVKKEVKVADVVIVTEKVADQPVVEKTPVVIETVKEVPVPAPAPVEEKKVEEEPKRLV